MVLAEGTTNLMQRLSRLPSAPDVSPLRRRKPVPSSLSHNHHLHIRWGCIDRLRPPRFPGTSTLTSDRRSAGLFPNTDNPLGTRTDGSLMSALACYLHS